MAKVRPICCLARGKSHSEEKGFRRRQGELAQLDLDESLGLKHSHYSDLFVFGQLVLTFSDSPTRKVIVHWFVRKRWCSKQLNRKQRAATVMYVLRFYRLERSRLVSAESLKSFSGAVTSFLTQTSSQDWVGLGPPCPLCCWTSRLVWISPMFWELPSSQPLPSGIASLWLSASLTLFFISNLSWPFIFSTLPISFNFPVHLLALFNYVKAFRLYIL